MTNQPVDRQKEIPIAVKRSGRVAGPYEFTKGE